MLITPDLYVKHNNYSNYFVYSCRLICPKRNYICVCTYPVYLSFCVYMWTVLQSALCVHVLESRTALVVLSLKDESFYGRKGYMCVILCTEFHILTQPTHKPQRAQTAGGACVVFVPSNTLCIP